MARADSNCSMEVTLKESGSKVKQQVSVRKFFKTVRLLMVNGVNKANLK